MTERFTETLRRASEPTWSQAVQHRFVTELFAGAISDRVMAGYLIQDHRFLDRFLTLLGAAIASAESFEARLRFGRGHALLCRRALRPQRRRMALSRLAHESAEVFAVELRACGMDHTARQSRLRDFVAFLRAELDRVGPAEEKISRDFFLRAVVLERAVFDAAYESEG